MASTITERPGRHQHDVGGGARRVGRAGDGDAGIRLLQGWRVVHAVAGHANDVVPSLQHLDDVELVLGKDLRESVGLLDGHRELPGLVCPGAGKGGGVEDVLPEPQLLRDLPGDGKLVSGDHLHLDPHLRGGRQRCPGVGARRIVQGQHAEHAPHAVGAGPGHAQRPVATRGEATHRGLDLAPGVRIAIGHRNDDLRGALGHRELRAIGSSHRGLGALVHRVERAEVEESVGFERPRVFHASQHRDVDGVLALRRRRQRRRKDDLGGPGTTHTERIAKRQRVLRQRACLVGAEHVQPGQLLHGGQVGDDGLLPRQRACADGHRHREHRGHRHRHRRDSEHERELQRRQHVVAAEQRHHKNERHKRQRHDDQEVPDAQHRALEVAHRVRRLHQVCRLSEERLLAGGDDAGVHLARADHRAGVDRLARLALHGQRLPGQGTLVDLDRLSRQQRRVSRDDLADADVQEVPWHEKSRRNRRPRAIPPDAGGQRELRPERGDGVPRLEFLPEADCRVHQQQRDDDHEVLPVAHHRGQDRGHLDHPGNRSPEIREELQQRVRPLRRQLVVSESGELLVRRGTREARRGTGAPPWPGRHAPGTGRRQRGAGGARGRRHRWPLTDRHAPGRARPPW